MVVAEAIAKILAVLACPLICLPPLLKEKVPPPPPPPDDLLEFILFWVLNKLNLNYYFFELFPLNIEIIPIKLNVI